MAIHRSVRGCSVLAAVFFSGVAAAQTASNPVTADPSLDTLHPPSQEELTIDSHGAKLNGFMYVPAGTAQHPIVVFLHGYPGNERNLDLAQAVRRAGYDALYIDFRGSWGSGGVFSFQHTLEDASAVLDWIHSPAVVRKYHIDASRIALVGHSMGGWAALMTGAHAPASVCVAGLAPWNIGWNAAQFAAHPDQRKENLAYFRQTTDAGSGPIRGVATDLLHEMESHADAWNYLGQAPGLRNHAVLLAGATHDSPEENNVMTTRMEKALAAAGAYRPQNAVYDDDHPFSAHRIALAKRLIAWLQGDCAATQGNGTATH